jgi:hypothetical protein
MTLKELPLGNKTFADIIDGNFLYADKTQYIYELLRSGKGDFFLSRPRRFGKTILLYTLNELFSSDRERFKGLWIDQSDYDFQKRPVLFLSLSSRSNDTEKLELNILNKLRSIAIAANLEVDGATPDMYISNLIQALYRKNSSKVVVLIDEYDAPVTRCMGEPEVAAANANVLHDFFAILKDVAVAPCIHLSFLTGVTRYALTSMDSGPNFLNDISLDPKFAGICGFPVDEFDSLFANRMKSTLLALQE